MTRLLFITFLLLTGVEPLMAQQPIEERMKWYAKTKTSGIFFVHFDKNVYTNAETAYFTGYLLRASKTPYKEHKVVSVALIRDADSTIIEARKFAMENGISFGSITLPDSILTGDYRFITYTENLVNGLPDVLFTQNITVKSTLDPPFRSQIKLLNASPNAQQNYQVMISATNADGRFPDKPVEVTYHYDGIKKTAKTDATGQVIITVNANQQSADNRIYVKLKLQKDSSFMSLNLPQQKAAARVRFYPEGGNLIHRLSSNIAWEIKDQQQKPLSLKAILFKNQMAIDTLESNSYGIGQFRLTPEPGARYALKPIHSGLTDSLYVLPAALEKGITIIVPDALPADTFRVQLRSIERQKITLLLHNFDDCFLNVPYDIENNQLQLKFTLQDIPKGLTTLTVLDSMGRPLAERLFFAHHGAGERLKISTDERQYAKRQKVNLKLELDHHDHALVSIAVAQDNRYAHKKMTDIESYLYLTSQLSALPLTEKDRPFKNTEYLQQMLLVKGWRRYQWPELATFSPADTLFKVTRLKLHGQLKAKKPITTAMKIGVLGGQQFGLLDTDKSGYLAIHVEDLIMPSDKIMYMFINGGQNLPELPKLHVVDEFEDLNRKIASWKRPDETIMPSELVNNALLVIPNNEKILRLKEVVITNKTSLLSGQGKGANACGDYVCLNNILNCRNHINDFKNTYPIAGRSYMTAGAFQVYAGCKPVDDSIFTRIKSLHFPKEFYLDEYKDVNEPAFFSTIYWNYNMALKKGTASALSFYTGDIAGKFKVTVQGLSNKDVIYAEHFFEVK